MVNTKQPSFDAARSRFRPQRVRWLFIAEAPPASVNGDRFFYFERVIQGDSLFLSLMRILYPHDYGPRDAKAIRADKGEALIRFMKDGCFLQDASADPILGDRKNALRQALPSLLERLEPLRADAPRVILISRTVFDICRDPLEHGNWNVLNKEMIPFPGSGQQRRFAAVLTPLLKHHGWQW